MFIACIRYVHLWAINICMETILLKSESWSDKPKLTQLSVRGTLFWPPFPRCQPSVHGVLAPSGQQAGWWWRSHRDKAKVNAWDGISRFGDHLSFLPFFGLPRPSLAHSWFFCGTVQSHRQTPSHCLHSLSPEANTSPVQGEWNGARDTYWDDHKRSPSLFPLARNTSPLQWIMLHTPELPRHPKSNLILGQNSPSLWTWPSSVRDLPKQLKVNNPTTFLLSWLFFLFDQHPPVKKHSYNYPPCSNPYALES